MRSTVNSSIIVIMVVHTILRYEIKQFEQTAQSKNLALIHLRFGILLNETKTYGTIVGIFKTWVLGSIYYRLATRLSNQKSINIKAYQKHETRGTWLWASGRNLNWGTTTSVFIDTRHACVGVSNCLSLIMGVARTFYSSSCYSISSSECCQALEAMMGGKIT